MTLVSAQLERASLIKYAMEEVDDEKVMMRVYFGLRQNCSTIGLPSTQAFLPIFNGWPMLVYRPEQHDKRGCIYVNSN